MEKMKGLTKEEVVTRGNAIEKMIATDGWKYLEDDLEKAITIGQINLERLAITRNIEAINETAMRIKVYRYMLDKPKEYIKAKNEVLKKGGKK